MVGLFLPIFFGRLSILSLAKTYHKFIFVSQVHRVIFSTLLQNMSDLYSSVTNDVIKNAMICCTLSYIYSMKDSTNFDYFYERLVTFLCHLKRFHVIIKRVNVYLHYCGHFDG